ncbi:MAG: benzoate-CoA ligase family protein [Acidimicrobiales bacterium]
MSSFNTAQWLVDRHVDSGRGQRVAIRCQGRTTTYAELQAEIWRAQALLSSLNVSAGDRVALVLQDDETFPALFLGAQRSGIVPVAISTMLKGPEIAAIVADSGAETLAISSTFAAAIPDVLSGAPVVRRVIVSGDTEFGSAPAGMTHAWADAPPAGEMPLAETTADSPAFWLYSSGTTGVPKGVMHRHGNVPATVETYAKGVLEITEDDRFLSIAKLFFAYGLGNSLTFPFAVGATAILEPAAPTPQGMVDLITSEQPTLFFASPGFAAAVLDIDPDPNVFAPLRATVTAGESLPANVQTRFSVLTERPVLDGIGSTELLHIFISNTLEAQTPGSSGSLVPGYEAQLRDDNDNVIDDPDTAGFLHVRGPSAALGYWQRPDETAAAFHDGWVRAGDVYTRSIDGYWTFLGRNNDMIKAGGIWVSPAEVESVLIEHADVLEAAVVGSRDQTGLETAVAFVVPASGATPDSGALDQHCRDRMAAFKRPRVIHVVEELPKTATGKIKRYQLRESVRGESASSPTP